MKIACPKCGQHYDVEANALDHFFRCTECKTFFRGLNAKSVKLEKCKIKENPTKTPEEAPSEEYAGDTASSVEISPDEIIDENMVEDLSQPKNASTENDSKQQSSTQVIPPLPSELFQDAEPETAPAEKAPTTLAAIAVTLPVAVIAVFIGVIALITAIVCNARINDLQAENADFRSTIKQTALVLEKTEKQLEIINGEIKRAGLRLDSLEKNTSALSTKLNNSDAGEDIKLINENLKNLKQRLDNLSRLDDVVESCRQKLEDMEKSRRGRNR